MQRAFGRALLVLLALCVFSAVASADELPVGTLSLDATDTSGLTGSFDISNFTGGVLTPDFPVLTTLGFSITSLTVNFETGPADVLTAADFTSDGNGGFTQNSPFNLSTDPILSAVLVGTLTPTTGVDDGGGPVLTILAAFTDGSGNPSVTLADATGGPLVVDDSAVIYATTTTGGTTGMPEPGTGALLTLGILGLLGGAAFRRKLQGNSAMA